MATHCISPILNEHCVSDPMCVCYQMAIIVPVVVLRRKMTYFSLYSRII